MHLECEFEAVVDTNRVEAPPSQHCRSNFPLDTMELDLIEKYEGGGALQVGKEVKGLLCLSERASKNIFVRFPGGAWIMCRNRPLARGFNTIMPYILSRGCRAREFTRCWLISRYVMSESSGLES
jgi:hypothetical protein